MYVVNQYGEKWNGLAEVVAFCHVTCRYFDRFLLQGVDKNWRQACFFYLAPGLICEGYWQVNSQRSIFCIADPNNYGSYCAVTGGKGLQKAIIKSKNNIWNKKYKQHMVY